jgi:hypothetical protein
MHVLFGIGLQQPRRRPFERLALKVRFVERARQAVEHLLHERAASDAIVAVDIGAQIGRGAVDYRLRHECLSQPRHPEGK